MEKTKEIYTKKDYEKEVQKYFVLDMNEELLNRHNYCNDDYVQCINKFRKHIAELGLSFGKVYHEYGIGNNNEYPILLKEEDDKGFVIEKLVCKFHYTTGIYGGVFACLYDTDGNQIARAGHAR